MKLSCNRFLPENMTDFVQLQEDEDGRMLRFRQCIQCKAEFSPDNCKNALAWCETQISGFCGNCWDEIFSRSDRPDERSTL